MKCARKISIASILALLVVMIFHEGGFAQMNASALKNLQSCSPEEIKKVQALLDTSRGGAGGSIIKWIPSLNCAVVFPGHTGAADGSGGAGAIVERNIQEGSVMRLKSTEPGLEISLPGYRSVIPWNVIDDMRAQPNP